MKPTIYAKNGAIIITTITGIEKAFFVSEISGMVIRGRQIFFILKGHPSDDGFVDCLPTEEDAHNFGALIMQTIEIYKDQNAIRPAHISGEFI
jgi:hypothetical protein